MKAVGFPEACSIGVCDQPLIDQRGECPKVFGVRRLGWSWPCITCRYCTAYSISMSPPALYFTLTCPGCDQLFELLSPQLERRREIPGASAIDERVSVCFALDAPARSRRRYAAT